MTPPPPPYLPSTTPLNPSIHPPNPSATLPPTASLTTHAIGPKNVSQHTYAVSAPPSTSTSTSSCVLSALNNHVGTPPASPSVRHATRHPFRPGSSIGSRTETWRCVGRPGPSLVAGGRCTSNVNFVSKRRVVVSVGRPGVVMVQARQKGFHSGSAGGGGLVGAGWEVGGGGRGADRRGRRG